jgi:hypothetical protein
MTSTPGVEVALVEVLDAAVPASAIVGTTRFAGASLLMPSAVPMFLGQGRKRQRQRGASDGHRHRGSCKAFHDRPPEFQFCVKPKSNNACALLAMTARP